ncbi:MAG TPA: WecB/TagA/CpsF family glycosyltransferase, partial [bacterium]|nr:WecB/TagA/CpsF family glycosyltransferase [bacterium]
ERLRTDFPGLRIAGQADGYSEDEEKTVEKIRRSGADILLAGLEMPRQEKWIRRNLHRLGVKAAIGVGGSFDVLSGALPRSPYFLRQMGLEWLYRFLLEPWRLGRIARLPVFLTRLFYWSFKKCL